MYRIATVLALIVATALVGCSPAEPPIEYETLGSADEPLSGRVEMTIENYKHYPSQLYVTQGSTIVVTNLDEAGQSVIADNDSFDTGILAQNETAEFTVDVLGTFNFYSEPYPNMLGQLIVVE